MACNEDSFTQVVKIDIPEHEPSIVVNAQFGSPDTLLGVLVSNSLGILDTTEHTTQESASVKVFRDDQPLGDFSYNPESLLFEARRHPHQLPRPLQRTRPGQRL